MGLTAHIKITYEQIEVTGFNLSIMAADHNA